MFAELAARSPQHAQRQPNRRIWVTSGRTGGDRAMTVGDGTLVEII
jgi:hypothetical protein